jgi:hypothetical protein
LSQNQLQKFKCHSEIDTYRLWGASLMEDLKWIEHSTNDPLRAAQVHRIAAGPIAPKPWALLDAQKTVVAAFPAKPSMRYNTELVRFESKESSPISRRSRTSDHFLRNGKIV